MAEMIDSETGEIVGLPTLPRREMNLIFTSPACDQVFGALVLAQAAMENPKKTKNAKVKGRTRSGSEYEYSYAYAPLEEIVNTIRAPLAAAKLVHRQFLAQRGDTWMMRTVIAHESGQWYGADYPIFWDETRGMQGFASGVTYARRYGLMMALGLVGEDDDDANVADGNPAKIVSRPRTAPERTNGTYDPPPVASPTTAPPEAAADDDRKEARKRHNELWAKIEECQLPEDVASWMDSPPWTEMEGWIRKADGVKADGVIYRIRQKALDRKSELERKLP